jgi:hypothetical protein
MLFSNFDTEMQIQEQLTDLDNDPDDTRYWRFLLILIYIL